jgi:ATP-dependent DNA helicase RecG
MGAARRAANDGAKDMKRYHRLMLGRQSVPATACLVEGFCSADYDRRRDLGPYGMPAPAQIRVYEDKLKIWNPAVLPEGWSLTDLLGEHSSAPFNPLVANAFFRAGEIEAWGRGIERIFQACRAAGTPVPQWRWTNNDLWLEFPFSAEYQQAIGGHSGRNDGAEVLPTGSTEGIDPVADPVADPVDRLLVVLAPGPLAPSAVQTALALKHRPTFRANYLRPAVNLGFVEMTLPEKPASRLQRYRLTDAGRARLHTLAPKGKPP